MKRAIIAILLLFTALPKNACSQSDALQPALDLPTRIIYDLFVDTHGFLWIATDLGISRYDGISVVTFSNSAQSSLAATGLCEDAEGKIWFTNFTGQIFYVQYEEMRLLQAYKANEELAYPKISVFGKKLIATSDKGLFVLDTKSLTGKYLKSSNSPTSPTISLAVMKDKVVINSKSDWFVYDQTGRFRQIAAGHNIKTTAGSLSTLNPSTVNDTAFLQTNPAGNIKKIIIRNDSVKIAQTIQLDNYINTTAIEGGIPWANTIKGSYSLNNKNRIKNLNVSDIVTDYEGNRWVSTLDKGLLVSYKKNTRINELNIESFTTSDDLVSASLNWRNDLLLGTKKGKFLTYNTATNTIIKTQSLEGNFGPINALVVTDSNTTYLGFPNFIRKIADNNVVSDLPIKYVREIVQIGQFILIASADGLFAIPENNSDSVKTKFVGLFGRAFHYDNKNKWYHLTIRCRSVSYYPEEKTLVAAFKNGLFKINKNGVFPILYQNQPVYSASVCYMNGNIYVGTFNKGLLIYHHNSIKQISVLQGLLSTSIFKLKPIAGHLWIMGSGPLQLFDLTTRQFINHYDLPTREDAQVINVEEINGQAYLATLNGLLTYRLDKIFIKNPPKNYLLGITVNNQSISTITHEPLHYSQNNLSFKIGIPSYYYGKSIYLKYRLLGGNDTTWQVSAPGERTINFPLLDPGSYIFKAVAIDPKSDLSGKVITYKFQILAPWWKRTWVRILVIIIILGLINYFIISYHLNKISFQQAFYAEQESVRTERQRISGEIHDDIGAGLFAIHLYADLASKKRKDVKEILEISTMVSDIADKIREIIWSTNIENDNLENLLYYIQFQVSKLFEHSSIQFQVSIPDDILDTRISSQVRRDLYLMTKELAHNAIKHSQAKNAELLIAIDTKFLTITFKDDGIGFDSEKGQIDSMGLENIRLRLKRLNGNLIVENKEFTNVIIKIPMLAIQTRKFNDTLKKWQILIFDIFKRSHFPDSF
ncbi:MAG: ATP-binding protein [Mucilaginibacter sp.]